MYIVDFVGGVKKGSIIFLIELNQYDEDEVKFPQFILTGTLPIKTSYISSQDGYNKQLLGIYSFGSEQIKHDNIPQQIQPTTVIYSECRY